MFLGLRTVVYHVSDLDKAKGWYGNVLGVKPYFNEAFYVGFNVGGYELGLHPDGSGASRKTKSEVAYWGVQSVESSLQRLLELGAVKHEDVEDVGGGIKVASVLDPFGNIFGIIENPHFSLESK